MKGKCFYNQTEKKLWVEIPKNASKTVSHHLIRSSLWKNGNYIHDNLFDYKCYAIIRDPIQRWKGSTIELASHHMLHNKNNYDLLPQWFKTRNLKNFTFINDIHHRKMEYFTEGLQNVTWIAMDENFEQSIKYHLGIKEDLVKLNSTLENEVKTHIVPYVEEILSDSDFVNKLKQFYKEDIDLFESIKQNDKP